MSIDRGRYVHPEQQARRRIDAVLARAGWVVQDYRSVNLYAGVGVIQGIESSAVAPRGSGAGRLVAQDPRDEPASVLLERIRAERASAPPGRRRSTATP